MPNCTNAVCKPPFSFALSSSHRPNISLSLFLKLKLIDSAEDHTLPFKARWLGRNLGGRWLGFADW